MIYGIRLKVGNPTPSFYGALSPVMSHRVLPRMEVDYVRNLLCRFQLYQQRIEDERSLATRHRPIFCDSYVNVASRKMYANQTNELSTLPQLAPAAKR